MMADELWLTEVARRAGVAEMGRLGGFGRQPYAGRAAAPARAQRFTGSTMEIDLTISREPARRRRHQQRAHHRGDSGNAGLDGWNRAPWFPKAGSASSTIWPTSSSITAAGQNPGAGRRAYVRRVIDIQQSVGNNATWPAASSAEPADPGPRPDRPSASSHITSCVCRHRH